MRKEISNLKNQVLQMANHALNMLDGAVKALSEGKIEDAEKIEEMKYELREFDDQIEAKTLQVIMKYQPMAIDLRRLATILKIITYLYRIGRYGKDIAKVVEFVQADYPLSELVGIQHMWEHVKPMINDAIDSFNESKIEKIQNFEQRDDEVDQMRWSIFRESISYMMENPNNITISAHIIMIARYLERCGDNACKIAEKVHYMVTGKHTEIS